MCKYAEQNKCKITNDVCPYMYYCEKIKSFKESPSMPKKCKIQQKYETPIGSYKVVSERKGFLYVDLGEETIKVKNVFDSIPLFVKIRKTQSGYKIRK